MKRTIILAVCFLLAGFAAKAQNYMVVNSETVFMSLSSYTDALKQLDNLGQQYQTEIDNAFEEVERMYNEYQAQKAYLSQTTRQQREDAIINREKEILAYQEEIFGQEGELLKKRVELIRPIQDRVYSAINSYAQNNNYELVLDIAQNPTILYYAPSADKTEAIIASLSN